MQALGKQKTNQCMTAGKTAVKGWRKERVKGGVGGGGGGGGGQCDIKQLHYILLHGTI